MSGFIAVIQNSFRETLDMKTFWVFLVLTVLSALSFSLIQFTPRENRDEVARDAIVNVLKNSIVPKQVQRRPGGPLNLDASNVEKTEANTFRVDLTLPSQSENTRERFKKAPIGLLTYLFTPSKIKRNSGHAGFGKVTISEPELTIRVNRSDENESLEATRPVPEEVWNKYHTSDFHMLDVVRNPEKYLSVPDEILNRFEGTSVYSVLKQRSDKFQDLSSNDSSQNTSNQEKKTVLKDLEPVDAHLRTTIEFVKTNDKKMPGGSKLSFRFFSGSYQLDLSKNDFLLTNILGYVVPYISGWFGVLLGLIITSNFIPVLLREGEIELLLTKRTPRWLIFTGRFVGAGLFFGLLTGVFLCLSSLILYLSTGVFTGYMLSSFLPLMLIFFMVYSISAFIGLVTRSQVLSILGSIFGWIVLWAVEFSSSTIDYFLQMFNAEENSHWSVSALNKLDMLLPSGSEINALSMKFMQEMGIFSEYTIEVLGLSTEVENLSILEIMLSSTGFILVFLLLSLVVFYRKEF